PRRGGLHASYRPPYRTGLGRDRPCNRHTGAPAAPARRERSGGIDRTGGPPFPRGRGRRGVSKPLSTVSATRPVDTGLWGRLPLAWKIGLLPALFVLV